MSRAYRISVRETLNRVIRAQDHVSTQLELLEILPPEVMAQLLRAELEKRGFESEGEELVREQDGVRVTDDPATGTVTVHAEAAEEVELKDGKDSKRVREATKKELQKELEGKAGAHREKLQSQVTDRLEAQLGDIRKELHQAVNRVTAEALKQKAAQLGQIKEMTEDAQSGSMTIVLEV
jgi:hypothetical protein